MTTNRHSFRSLVLAPVLAGTLVAQEPEAPRDAAALREGLGGVRAAMTAGDWAKASQALAATLKQFENTDVARRARIEIVGLDRRCRFQASYQPPALQSLVSGKILRYQPKSGAIRIRYTPNTMRDFVYADQLGAEAKKSKKKRRNPLLLRLPRRRSAADYRFHPAVFRDYKAVLRGNTYSRTSFLVCVNQDSAHEVEVGVPPYSKRYSFGPSIVPIGLTRGRSRVRWIPSSIYRITGAKRRVKRVEKQWGAQRSPPKKLRRAIEIRKWYAKRVRYPVADGKPFQLELAVSATRITLKNRGRTVVACSKGRNEHGVIALRGARFRDIEITGKVDRSWLQNKLDAHRNAALTRFERRYRPEKVLPEWLFASSAAAEAAATTPLRPFPGNERPDVREYNKAFRDLRRRNYRSLLLRLTFTGLRKVPKVARAYVQAQAHLGLGMLDQAVAEARVCFDADPKHYGTLILLAAIAGQRGKHQDEVKWYRRATGLRPDQVVGYERWADSHLWRGEVGAARAVLGKAAAAGVGDRRLDRLAAGLRMMTSGPDWARRFTVETRHFAIHSDIDKKTCRDAGIVLEQAFAAYSRYLGAVKNGQKRFQVFLFSGRAGFDRYCANLRMGVPIHTAGLYSPRLKQLLIWNLANRTEMMRTIRHEGLHQFLDVLMPQAPVWFNEGLAEYFEQARTLRGAPVPGILQERHLRALALVRGKSRPTVDALMRMPRELFYARAQRHYPMSWALVHFLRHSGGARRKIFDGLVKGLKAGRPYVEVLKEVMAGVDMKKLDAAYWEHVRELR